MYNDIKTVVFVLKKAYQTDGKVFSCKTKCNTAWYREFKSLSAMLLK